MSRFLFITILFFSITINSFSQVEVEFLPTDWENPTIFEKGQTTPHAFHIPYSTKDAAIFNRVNRNDNFQLLNGLWKFKLVQVPDSVPQGFWKPKFDVKEWDEIKVPANWQMEGFDHPKFRNITLTFESDPPKIPYYFNPTGCYKRKFTVPKTWVEKEIFLRFEGIKSAAYIWINGKRVGYNQGGFEPAEFNITPFIEKGENDLAVEVIRFSDGSYLENQDMWRLSGIYRDVKLVALPKNYVRDFYITTDLDKDYKDATLIVETDIHNALSDTAVCVIEIDVFDSEGRSILRDGIQSMNFTVVPDSTRKLTISTFVVDPTKWSAEHPNLFTLLVHLKDKEGKTLEAFTKKMGFREVEYKNKILTVNGVPVKLNGVNSHMHDPEYGQAVPLETLRKDLVIMKQFNINCVRTCHYPPTPEYIEMADELGMYIVDEVGVEAHMNEYLSEDPKWTEMYRERSRKLVYRDRNHPSVIVWSAGNESGSGFNINEVIKTGKAIDPSRPAWMYGGNTFYIPFEDIVGPRYWNPIDYKNMAEGKVLPENDKRASFMDEYLAATGNGLGGMDEYWEYIWKYPRLTGGAIWDWISPGIKTPRWIIPDLSPNKKDGQIMGRPVFMEGKNGRGLEFSGHDDWIEFYRDPSLDISGKQLSIGFWVKPSKIPQANNFITKGKHQFGIIMENPETLEFYVYGDKRISAKAKVGGDFYENWHHIAGIYDGNKLQLYIDEKAVAQTNFNGNISLTPFPLCIGREAETQDQGEYSGRLSKMIIDDVKIFDKAVSVNDLKNDTTNAVLALNFENDDKEGDFYAVGLGGRTYGIVWPDREIQPEIYQIKKSGQPVKIEPIDVENGKVKITNRHQFTNLNELQGVWQISVNGDTIQRGFFEIDLPAGQTTVDSIPYRMPTIEEGSECMLAVSFLLKEDTNWAKKGHEIAWDEMLVKTPLLPLEKPDLNGKVAYAENENELTISGAKFKYVIDKKTGNYSSLLYNGAEYLEGGPVFNVWRAPLANDIDPWGSQQFQDRNFTPGFGRSIDNQLRTLGMRDLVQQVDEIEILQNTNSKLEIRIKAFSHTTQPANAKLHGWIGVSGFQRNETWTVLSDGTIELEQEIIPHGPMPDMLQKIGLQFQLPKQFSNVEWYGRGPFENYPDRKTGAKVGHYFSNADEMYVPYIFPQEYGNRSDVRWLKVQNADGKGLMISGGEFLNFSLHKYTTDNLDRAVYTYQLKKSPNTILNVDYEVTGVGGTAIRQLQRYRVTPHAGKYKLRIKPF
jgi:beta-galactosidase